MIGTGTPNAARVSTIFGTAAAACFGVDRDAHQLRTGARQRHHLVHRDAMSAVSVLVIDCTTIG